MLTKIIVGLESTTGAIGYNGDLCCSIKGDLAHFRKVTKNTTNPTLKNLVVMGRKTWDSLPKKPLDCRINLVFSHSKISGLDVVSSIDEYHHFIEKNKEKIETVFIIGGASIYRMFLEAGLVSEVIATVFYPKTNHKILADTYFPMSYLDRFTKMAKIDFIGEDEKYSASVEYYKYKNKID